uniref:Vacuolar protein sorting 55 n=1 Tax=Peronospora matthiolae TaxID=2874970 RepID=A0AAV1UGV5_9STRA
MKFYTRLSVAGLLLLLALGGVIVASAAYSTSWGLFVLCPYVLLPMTAAVFSNLAGGEDPSAWTNFGCFFEAFLWTSTVAIPSILYRVDALDISQVCWLMASSVLVFASFMSLVFTSGD